MALATGTRLGPYEVTAQIGAGGMGEVYKARDTRLDRAVAVKVLPPNFAAAPDLRERFEREARIIASLSHPHICTLHDVGRHEGTDFLVMEYLDGETLEQRLTKGAIAIDQALQIAIHIADALRAAHRAGVVHRDLKPGNIMLTRSGAKLLDFGLARTSAPAVAGNLSMLPTTPPGLTQQGTILGTFQYMAPEQLEGREADARTDVFAFGLVLHEMITGRRVFEGKTHANLIAAIMHVDPPPLSTLQPSTPASLDRVVGKCLEKDPGARWQSAQDLWDVLQWCAAGGLTGRGAISERPRKRGMVAAWATAAAALAAAALLAGMRVFESSPPVGPARFSVSAAPETIFVSPTAFTPLNQMAHAVSPDGRHLAFLARGRTGPASIWIRPLESLDASRLAGTEGAALPFWSPDSMSIGFFAGGKLRKIDLTGGPSQTLADGSSGAGATWNREGTILFVPNLGSPVYRVSSAGGTPVAVTSLDLPSGKASSELFPSFLPDGRHFLFFAPPGGVFVGSLDSQETKPLLQTDSHALYASGYLLFQREGTLLAQAFDPRRLELTGEAMPVAEQVGLPVSGFGRFSVSDTGVLVYRTDEAFFTELRWVDRRGTPLGTVGPESTYINPALSSDGTRVLVGRRDRNQASFDLWLFDLPRRLSSRFTFDAGTEYLPLWGVDGKYIAYTMDRGTGKHDLYRRLANGAGDDELIFASETNKILTDWTSDGRFLVFDESTNTGFDLSYVPVSGDRKGVSYLKTPFNEQNGHVSPDGRWLAYQSDESGRYEIYVRPFPDAQAGKWQISSGGGTDPRWSRDGKELFYFSDDDQLLAVAVGPDASGFTTGKSEAMFSHMARTANRTNYAMTPDGQRFLINTVVQAANDPVITVLLNWPQALQR